MFYRSAEVTGVAGHDTRDTRSVYGHGARSPDNRHARQRRLRRARLLVLIAIVAFTAGIVVSATPSSPPYAHRLAARFTAAWARGDYAAMYADIDPAARRELSLDDFTTAYQRASVTATATRLQVAGAPRDARGQIAGAATSAARSRQTGVVVVPVRVHTLLFGTLSSNFVLPVVGHGAATRIAWSRTLLFPGLRTGERLTRDTALPPRAALLARDGSILVGGPATVAGARESPLGAAAAAIAGSVGPIPSTRLQALESQGVPADALVGVSGLELALDERLRGTPGGQLLAGERVLASATPHPAQAVRTTVDPAVQSAAVTALGGQYGGIVALEPSSGAILAVAGIGLDDLQPPGSTFKMITATAALQAHVATPTTVFPYGTYATLDGVKLSNANGEDCGGSLALAFAVSCNSVFAPLGVRVGAPRLVATAERFGFNQPPGVIGAVESTLPPAAQIQGELDVGSTAIGQGEVSASALEMATVAATIADGGLRPQPTFSLASEHSGARVRATTPSVARTVRRLMIGVVREGTGTAAAIPGVTVAGKTGTAELGTPAEPCKSASESGSAAGESGSGDSASDESSSSECSTSANDPQNTDAWFAAFAPALHPRIVVGVLMVRDGAGGTTAAPVARQVLEAGLRDR
jgi:peptidoglycan glycosyltransferase